MFGLLTAWKRRRLAARPFPEAWLKILNRRVAFFAELPATDRQPFLDKLKVFVWEKHWIPAGGMEITDEVKVTIAAAAVRLSLHLEDAAYDRLTEIVIYPYVYKHEGTDGAILGEAHSFGTVVLSWPAVQQGLANRGDGHETAGHEFAHVLDRADGTFDGTPELHASEHYRPWGAIMSHHFARLQAEAPEERRVLRRYGATNPVEFFAVATESFFEKPVQMKERTPDLYEELCRFYGSDPAATFGTAPAQPGKIGRNDPCPCGSGKKHKKCCGAEGLR